MASKPYYKVGADSPLDVYTKDDLDGLIDSLEILDFNVIEVLVADTRLPEDLLRRAKELHKIMFDHLFAGNPGLWFGAEKTMEQVEVLQLEANTFLISSGQVAINEALTHPNPAMRKAAQHYYRLTHEA